MSLCIRTLPLKSHRQFLRSTLKSAVFELRFLHTCTLRTSSAHPPRHLLTSLKPILLLPPSVRLLSSSVKPRPTPEQIKLAKQLLKEHERKGRTVKDWTLICVSIVLLMIGISAACVPLYKIFCSATGYGGTTQKHNEADNEKVRTMTPVDWRPITVSFTGTVSPGLDWEFIPVQSAVSLVPGETCLAFFTAKNNSPRVITGISTYNVTPFEAGAYFNKIQCFCFDEQTLNPGEELDMPVFFYIDPEFVLDPDLVKYKVDHVSLHYTFFDTAGTGGRFDASIKELASYLKGEATSPPDFTIPEGDKIIPINDKVYREVIRRGYNKEFVGPGSTVVCHVTGVVPDTGQVFWSTKGGNPFTFKAGVGSLVEGWEEGCLGMSEGEISKIFMSSTKGYGKLGNRSWNIPGHTNIAFELEILAVR